MSSEKVKAKICCPVCRASHVPTQGQLTDGVYAATCQACGHFFKFRPVSQIRSTVSFTVNGKQYSVGNDADLTVTLADFLREQRISMGTKFLCREGGCGMCVVETKLYEPVSEERKSYAINSCLCPVFLCDGWEITTIEGLGNQRSGLHPIQDTLAGYNGSQCGFCSPAQIMNMYALLQQIPEPTQQQVEDIYDGITCRCTGYRSIMDAMKSFAKPDDKMEKKCMTDIEDLNGKLCKKTGQHCHGNCKKETTSEKTLHMVLRDAQWLKPTSLDELYSMMKQYKDKSVRLTFGCSGWGVYKDIGPWMYDVLIDLHGIQELYNFSFDPEGQIGANVTLTQMIDIFEKVQPDDPDLPYLSECAQYMKQVAHTNVRNVGTWAGNLILKKLHPEFPSDIFVMLETVGVQVGLNDTDFVSPQQLLTTDLTEKVITFMVLPTYSTSEIIKFYRVSKRTHNAHAYVNAGFRMNVDKANNFLVKKQPSLVFGGINKTFTHASKTEAFLTGKQLLDPNVIKNALLTLQLEIVPDSDPVDANPAYRRDLALAFFYRYVLYVLGDHVGSRLQSGSTPLVRSLSSGQQTYDTNKQEWPLTEPLQKLEAKAQVTGEAEYVNDIPLQPGELHAAFVISTVGNAKIQSIDASAALLLPSVLRVLTASDIPSAGVNNCMPSPYVPEEVLCSGEVLYAGQAVALVIAENQVTADFAASLVKVTYSDIKPPILTIQDAVKEGSLFPKQADDIVVGNAEDAIAKSPKKVSGSVSVGTQFHFPMETQVSICIPTEDGMKVHATTQWTDYCQKAVALVLGIPSASIDVEVRRLGGAFGSKISKNFIVSAACALAAYVMKRPVRLLLNFHTNMEMMGKRFPYAADYQVGFDTTGKLNGVKITYYCDCGCSPNDCTLSAILNSGDNSYYCPNWHMIPVAVKTNSPSHTYCRAPGTTPGIFMMETIMEHIAKELGVDPTQVKTLNLYQKGQLARNSNHILIAKKQTVIETLQKPVIILMLGKVGGAFSTKVTPGGMPLPYCSIASVMSELEQMAEVQIRQQQIQTFNAANRWKKMGMSVVPIKYGVPWNGQNYGVQIAVYSQDGTVAVSHGGVEVGQGINTKVAQVVAYEFEIPVDMVKLKPTTSFISAGSGLTGSSVTSELCCQAAISGCQEIKDRMAPVKAKMDKPTWLKVVQECFNEGIDLSAHAWFKPDSPHVFQYNTYGTVCTEVEFDVLTGDHQITRVDLLFDCGESMNPGLDIGQVEGAFVMGLGYWLTEECKYDPQSGQLLTNDTWEYKLPLHKDIPIDFRVHLLKNAPNPLGVLRAKACGEPPLCMSCSAVFALKHAIEAARKEIGQDEYFELNGPATVEALQMACLLDPSQFVIQ